MQSRIRRMLAAVTLSSVVLSASPTAFATQTVSSSFKCSITSKAPVLVGTTITTFVSITCNKSATVTVDLKAVEMDGSNEQSNVVMAENKGLSVSVSANVAKTISTTGSCVNTETGYEEYATKARVGIGSTYSSYDRTSPSNDSYNC